MSIRRAKGSDAVHVLVRDPSLRGELERAVRGVGLTPRLDASAEDLLASEDEILCVSDDLRLAHAIAGSGEPLTVEAPAGGLFVAQRSSESSPARVLHFDRNEIVTLAHGLGAIVHAAQADLASHLLGRSPAMRDIRREVRRLATFPQVSVMVLGESGVGKELVARALHGVSTVGSDAFVAINCAAVPTTLFESTLFGHREGAFTGAAGSRAGLLEEAGGGTLFLDEVVDMPARSQGKLLRAIEQRTFERVGDATTRSFDARIVSATNGDPRDHERFRPDLLHRLAGYCITVPPLRERDEDVLDLAPAFLQDFCARHGLGGYVFTEDSLEELRGGAPWAGNVRELRVVVEHLAIVSSSPVIEVSSVRAVLRDRAGTVQSQPPAPPLPRGGGLRELEQDVIVRTVEHHDGNLARAARQLGISRSTLRSRLRSIGPSLSENG